MIEKTHYKRMLNQVINVFEDFRDKKVKPSYVGSIAKANISTLDNINDNLIENTRSFQSIACYLEEDYEGEEQYREMIKLINEYEPYIHELLKIDR